MNTVFLREVEFFGFRVSLSVRRGGGKARRLRSRNEKVVEDYRSGDSIRELADKYGVTVGRISQILVEAGARLPRWSRMTSNQRRLIHKLDSKGLSKSEIGRQVGVSRTRVRQILQDSLQGRREQAGK
jgi:DNA-directed RNA polymerase sigma subunit (sigma70/sigma32)